MANKQSDIPSISTKVSKRNEVFETFVTIPPDGGWGWVIVFASFMSNMIMDGTLYCFGLFLAPISATYGVNPTRVATVNSLMSGICFTIGPLTCAIINRYGFRIIGFAGGIVTSVALFGSCFMPSITGFIVFLGILAGVGFSLIYVPAVVVIGFYFDRWRSLAVSIAVSGSAVGMSIFPPLMQYCLNTMSWQDKFKILSCGFLLSSFLALTYIPLKSVRVLTDDNKKIYAYLSISDEEIVAVQREGCWKRFVDKFHRKKNIAYPKTIDVVNKASTVQAVQSHLSTSSTFLASMSINTLMKSASSQVFSQRLAPLPEVESIQIRRRCCPRCKRACRRFLKCCFCHPKQPYPSRPMYRDDIFLTTSVADYSRSVIPQGASRAGMSNAGEDRNANIYQRMEDYMSVSRIVTQKDIHEQGKCTCCPEAITRTLATMLDFTLLKSPSFVLLGISGMFTILGTYSPFMYICEKALQDGVSPMYANYLLTALGVANGVGRVGIGLIATIPSCTPLLVSAISLTICGAVTIVAYFLTSTITLYIYAVLFGLSLASFPCLRASVTVDLIGLEQLTSAFGILMLFQGGASFAGVPISSAIVSLTHSYGSCFLFSGGALLISGILLFPIKPLAAREKKKAASNKA